MMESAAQNSTLKMEAIAPKRILVALDHGETHASVLQTVHHLAKVLPGQLMLCHCLPEDLSSPPTMIDASVGLYGSPYTATMLERSQSLMEAKAKEITSWLRGLQAQLNSPTVTVEFDHHVGDPGPYVCRLAEQWNADLIVVGRRGRKGLTEILLGSVSNYVVHHAPCSVWVAQ